jgi:hypothetical protein
VHTNGLENQGFHPFIVSLGRFYGSLFAASPDTYADVPVSKAIAGGGGLIMTGVWGWKVRLEEWAQDETKRKSLFEWSLQRAQTAAKESSTQLQEI